MNKLSISPAQMGFWAEVYYAGHDYSMWVSEDKNLVVGSLPESAMPDFKQFGDHVNDGVEWKKGSLYDFFLYLQSSIYLG